MLLGIIGDTHYTNRGPSRRKDNFFRTQIAKTCEAIDIFQNRGCECIFQSGDFFDSHTVADRVKSEIIQLLYCFGIVEQNKMFCVAGQHDISGHSLNTLPNSPLSVLGSSRVVKVLNSKPTYVGPENHTNALYGASFGEAIPEPSEDIYNILVVHAMIGNRLLYPGQKLTSPRRFLKQHPKFSLVICGDYHYPFEDSYQGRVIINAGCLVRKTISTFDLEHKPSVVVFDTETNKVEFIPLKVKPVEEVFDLSKRSIQNNFDVEKFVQALKDSNVPEKVVQWRRMLGRVINERESSQDVKDIIDSCIEEVSS